MLPAKAGPADCLTVSAGPSGVALFLLDTRGFLSDVLNNRLKYLKRYSEKNMTSQSQEPWPQPPLWTGPVTAPGTASTDCKGTKGRD